MNHEERLALARDLTQRILAKYGEEVLGVAIYGSVARNEDSEYSDLEMKVVTTNAVAESDVEYVHTSGAKVEINYEPEDTYLANAGTVSDHWWLSAGQYRSQLIIYQRDDGAVFARAAAAAEAVMQDEAQFKRRMAQVIVDELYELMDKIRSAWQRRDEENLRWLGQYFLYCTCCYLSLANRVYFTTSGTIWQQVRQFPILTEGFEDQLTLLAGFEPGSLAAVYRAAEELWANIQQLARQQGIVWTTDEWLV
jgi:kanamycin nucleotidyltransferase